MLAAMEAAAAPDAGETTWESTTPWSPPAELGPMPPELHDRARRLIGTQRAAISRLAEEQRAVGRHLAALRTVPVVTDATQSVYLDVTG